MITSLKPSDTRPLRHAILRPNQPIDACVYPGDDAPDSFHLGIRDEAVHGASDLIAVASFYREPLPDDPAGGPQLRIRGMAVLPEHHGRGFGSKLLQACMAYAAAHGGKALWCNARVMARPFYELRGLSIDGEEFDIPGIGPHYRMICPL